MTRKEINLIADALRAARGTYPLRDELNMWEICVSHISDSLESLPNFDRVPFLLRCGMTPLIKVAS